MVQETIILLRIQHFQQSTGRISVDPTTDLVNLVDEHKRVFGADSFECLDDFSRECTDILFYSTSHMRKRNGKRHKPNISPPVTFNFCYVRQATNREPKEPPP